MDSDIGNRLAELISTLNIKKVRFAERIMVDQSYITQLVKGRNPPSDRLINTICREFNVNESWLRTGEGEMFRPSSEGDIIAKFMGDILSGEPDFRQKLIGVLARMTPNEWSIMERKALELVDSIQRERSATTDTSRESQAETKREGIDIEAKVARYREQLELEESLRTSVESTQVKTG